MTEHPHAWFLRAIADGEPLENFASKRKEQKVWKPTEFISAIVWFPHEWQVRRKPRTIKIGNIDVPEPMREAPDVGKTYWLGSVIASYCENITWQGDTADRRWLAAGLCHATKEAAELHRKALILVSGGTP